MGYYRRRRWKRYKPNARSTEPRVPGPRPKCCQTGGRFTVSNAFGGIDSDIKTAFFALTPSQLRQVFRDYRLKHGDSRADYAYRAYEKWKTGEVQMTGEVCERLLAIVPKYLEFGVKYELVEKLWRKQDSTVFNITLNPKMDVNAAIDLIHNSLNNMKSTAIPQAIIDRLGWLAEGDGDIAKELYRQVIDCEFALIQENLRHELWLLFRLHREMPENVVVQATHKFKVPGGLVLITLTQTREHEIMSNELPKQPGDNLAARPNDQLAAPIENPKDLMTEALKRMTPEKQAEVLGKAADEALRLQVKGAENKMDLDILTEKMEQANRFAKDHAVNPTVQAKLEAEHRSKQGDTRITINTKPEMKKFCFLATACFENIEHPTVEKLRQFRDNVLAKHAAGRAFISWYYRHGPSLAAGVKRFPAVKPVMRWLLSRITHTLIR